MTADTPSPSEVVETLTALRVMCESCYQPLYVEILDEVLSAISARPSTVDEATVGWQPIETAPKDGTAIDVWVGGEFPGRRTDVQWREPTDSEWWVHGGETLTNLAAKWFDPFGPLTEEAPTHWRPLPEPPTSLPSVAVQPIGEP